jgi:hypothetical protein
MSRTRKEKLETYTAASLQLLPEESAAKVANNCIEIALEKKKKEANKPLYLRRI